MKPLTQQQKLQLMQQAQQARLHAYAPYSHFLVGAAILTESGHIYTGCNVENASYPAGLCAERCAAASAVSQGEQSFVAIAISGGPQEQSVPLSPAYPCGICRQVLREFCSPGGLVVLCGSTAAVEEYTLEQLLPCSFGPEFLTKQP